MSELNLEEGKILYDGSWLSVDDLTQTILEKMRCGDMKFAGMAEALEKLSAAIEQSHAIEVRIVLSKGEYEKLKALGGDDEKTCIRCAVQYFIDRLGQAGGDPTHEIKPEKKKTRTILCIKCHAKIDVAEDEPSADIECPFCGTANLIESDSQIKKPKEPAEDIRGEGKESAEPRTLDHFIG